MHKVGYYEDCMTMEETAEYLKMNPITFRGQYNEGLKIPHIRVAGRVWFRKCGLDSWLDAQARNVNQPWGFNPGAPVGYGPMEQGK